MIVQSAPLPANEAARLAALRQLAILDTDSEALYDDVTELASQICESPICLVSLVDAERQWFKSKHGLAALETPREMAFCAHAILGPELFEVEDSRNDPRFFDNPLVTDAPNVVFYAGIPLDLEAGLNVGTLCVIDSKPKKLTDKQRTALRCLANQIVAHLRLRRANQDLQKALNAKATFLATMSHEIRTPMNGILGITHILLDSTRDDDTRNHLRIINDCGGMLLTILNDILDFSKIESGKLNLEAHPFSLDTVVRNVREVMNPIARKKGLNLTLDSGTGPDGWVGDSNRISQVLMNLLGNAIKFTHNGTVTLAISREPAADGRYKLRFSIRDEGIGIPKEGLERLFRSFSQVDSSTTRMYGGTGLGLAISKGLAESMGGRIGVKSEVGKGSIFEFEVDLPESKVAIENKERASAEDGPIAEKKPLTILVAEDNRVNQIVAVQHLSKLGYTADLAANGIEVLRMLETKTYDLILMDCQMPEMDGFQATARILAEYPKERRPIIFALTAAITEEEQSHCLAVGMNQILHKPIRLEKLRESILCCPAKCV